MHNAMVSVGVSRMGQTGVIFIEVGAKVSSNTVNVFLVKDSFLISEPSVVSTDGLSSLQQDGAPLSTAKNTLGLYSSRVDTVSCVNQ